MPFRLAPIAIAATLVTPLAWATPAVADSTTLKAVVFDDVKPLYQKLIRDMKAWASTFWSGSGCRRAAARSTTAAQHPSGMG